MQTVVALVLLVYCVPLDRKEGLKLLVRIYGSAEMGSQEARESRQTSEIQEGELTGLDH